MPTLTEAPVELLHRRRPRRAADDGRGRYGAAARKSRRSRLARDSPARFGQSPDISIARRRVIKVCWDGARCCARAPPGHVVVCQPNNREVALMGELSAQTLGARGVLG